MWFPPEEQSPFVLQQPGRKSVGYFGAVRLRDGKFIFTAENESFNAISCWKFLKQLRKAACHSGRKVAIITDNARYHHAKLHSIWRNEASDKFVLEYLPPYSPDFNPIEKLWSKVKAFLRKCRALTLKTLQQSLLAAFACVTPSDCSNWFACARSC